MRSAVDVALTLEREQKMDPEEAVRRASHQRLRPILMTTVMLIAGIKIAIPLYVLVFLMVWGKVGWIPAFARAVMKAS